MLLDCLPTPALCHVLRHLEFQHSLRLRRVCRRLNAAHQEIVSFGLIISTQNLSGHVRSIDFGIHHSRPSHVDRLLFWYRPNWPEQSDLFRLTFVRRARRLHLYCHRQLTSINRPDWIDHFVDTFSTSTTRLIAVHVHIPFTLDQLLRLLDVIVTKHAQCLRYLAIFRANHLIPPIQDHFPIDLNRLPLLQQLHSDVGWTLTLRPAHKSIEIIRLPLGQLQTVDREFDRLFTIQTNFNARMCPLRFIRSLNVHLLGNEWCDQFLTYFQIEADQKKEYKLHDLNRFVLRSSSCEQYEVEMLQVLINFLNRCTRLNELAIYGISWNELRLNKFLADFLCGSARETLHTLYVRSPVLFADSNRTNWHQKLIRFERLCNVELHPLEMQTSRLIVDLWIDRAKQSPRNQFRVSVSPLPDSDDRRPMPNNLKSVAPSFKFDMW